MAEQIQRPVAPAKAEAPAAKPAKPDRDSIPEPPAGVGESTDPAVQQLLAERQGAVLNRQALNADDAVVKAADDAIADIDKRLGELGFN
jgi:hypothetical protein